MEIRQRKLFISTASTHPGSAEWSAALTNQSSVQGVLEKATSSHTPGEAHIGAFGKAKTNRMKPRFVWAGG